MPDLPLDTIAWHAEVTGVAADLTLDQTFHNDTDHVLDGTYVLPLPPGLAVDRMRIEVGEREVEGRVATWRGAQEAWSRAQTEGRLVELPDEVHVHGYSQHLTGIAPGETIHVVVGLVREVTSDDGRCSMTPARRGSRATSTPGARTPPTRTSCSGRSGNPRRSSSSRARSGRRPSSPRAPRGGCATA